MKALCQVNGAECKTCEGKNCNAASSFKKCTHCSLTEDPNCAENPVNSFTKTCKKYVDECYTSIGSVGILRGCLSEQSYEFPELCRKNADKCEICTPADGNACNKKPIKIEMCIECSLDKGDNCIDNFDLYRNKICSRFNSTAAEGCFVHIVSLTNYQ